MDRAVARGLRLRQVDVLTAAEADRLHLSDADHLTFATASGRVLYSANVADFARLHGEWLSAGLHHAGIVLLTDQLTPVGIQISALVRVLSELDSMQDRLEFLSGWTK